jgi:hypothetical protein
MQIQSSDSEPGEPPMRVHSQPRPASSKTPTVRIRTQSWKEKGKRKDTDKFVTMVAGTGTSLDPFQIEDIMVRLNTCNKEHLYHRLFQVERDVTFELSHSQSRVHGSEPEILFGPLGLGTEWIPAFHVSDLSSADNYLIKSLIV